MKKEEFERARSSLIAYHYAKLMADGHPPQEEGPVISPFVHHTTCNLTQVLSLSLELDIYLGSATVLPPRRSVETATHTKLDDLTAIPSTWMVFVQGRHRFSDKDAIEQIRLRAEQLNGSAMIEFLPIRLWQPQEREHEFAVALGTDIPRVHLALAEWVDLRAYVVESVVH